MTVEKVLRRYVKLDDYARLCKIDGKPPPTEADFDAHLKEASVRVEMEMRSRERI